MTSLSDANLAALRERLPVPAYDRSKLTAGIVHLGVGGFHRAHQAVYVDALMNTGQAMAWAIVGVGLLPQDRRMHEVLHAQDCLYTVVEKWPDGSIGPRVVGSVVEHLFAPDDLQRVLAILAAPTTRIVSLTITEGGYHVDQVTGEFDDSDPDIRADLRRGSTPVTAFGYLTEALARRRYAGTEPFVVMSCDNIPGNGDVTRKMLGAFARRKDPELGAWIVERVTFPSSMVDRITPVTTEEDRRRLTDELGIVDGWPVACEPFAQWVLEDRFPSGRPRLEDVGVQLVQDVEPYELMKLRLLNGGHQALCYLGYLSGHRYAHEVCADPLFVGFVAGYMAEEAAPTLPPVPGVDLGRYQQQLVERFANPQIRDTLARLCAESSDRIPKWVVPVVRERLAARGDVRRGALLIASWARYAEGVDESGAVIEVVDRRRGTVMARAQQQREEPLAFLDDPQLFGDLKDHPTFAGLYAEALASLHAVGARETLRRWESASA